MSLTAKQRQARAGLRQRSVPPSPRDRRALRRERWAWVYKRLSTHEQTKKSIWGLAMQDELEGLPIEDGYASVLTAEQVVAIRQALDFPGFYVNGQIHVEERDLGISGTKNHRDRPGLAALIHAIEANHVEAVYVLDIKRLYRDQYLIDAMTFAKLCRDHGVLIVTPMLTYDLTQEIYWEMYEIEVKNAARELKVLRFRLGGAKELKARHGFWDGRPVYWGYVVDLDPYSPTYQKYVLYLPHQEILLALFRLAAKYRRYRPLTEAVRRSNLAFPPFPPELHEQQFRLHAMRNCKLQPDGSYLPGMHSLDSILTNPTPLGWWPVGDALLKANHPAAVPEQLFWDVQEAFNPIDYRTGLPNQARRADQPRRRTEPVALLTGKLYCGMHPEDGTRSLHRVQAKGAYERKGGVSRYYGCTSDYDNGLSEQKCLYVSQAPIEQAVAGHLVESLQQYDLRRELAADLSSRAAEPKRRRQETARAVRQLRGESAGLKAKLPWAKTQAEYDLLMDEITDRQARIDQLEHEPRPSAQPSVTLSQIEDVQAFLNTISAHWHRVSLETRTRLIDVLLKRVTVFHDRTMRLELHVEWRTGVVDIIETLRPLPSRPPGWRWEAWEDEILRRHYATEPNPEALIGRLKPIRNWGSVMERAWKLGLSRPRDLTPWGTGRAAVLPIGERDAMNPTRLRRGMSRFLGSVWEEQYLAPESAAEQANALLTVSPAVHLLEKHQIESFSNGFSVASLR